MDSDELIAISALIIAIAIFFVSCKIAFCFLILLHNIHICM